MHASRIDALSPLARQIIEAGRYDKLVVTGGTSSDARRLLEGIDPGRLFAVPVVNWPAALAALAGLWLWHDALHECHAIVQRDPAEFLPAPHPRDKAGHSPQDTGSVRSLESDLRQERQDPETLTAAFAFWHGIMHRREGDFSNSHYWFRRAGRHPAMRLIEDYDGHALIDEVEAAHRRRTSPVHLIDRQRREWVGLFKWCVAAT